MQHFAKGFLEKINPFITDKITLEIGCGDGTRSNEIAGIFKSLTGIDPEQKLIEKANKNNVFPNRTFLVGSGEKLNFSDKCFDLVIFPLSLHHIRIQSMSLSINEAIRVLNSNGRIIFIEPTFEGSFIEAEILFGCCDGDERKEKAIAYFTILNSKNMKEILEFTSESVFEFLSDQDFFDNITTSNDNKNEIAQYLKAHNYKLSAKRRINIFEKVSK